MNEIHQALRERYPHIHPLMFHRCVERCKSNGELFDMLESLPQDLPIVWDEETRSWVITDLLQTKFSKNG